MQSFIKLIFNFDAINISIFFQPLFIFLYPIFSLSSNYLTLAIQMFSLLQNYIWKLLPGLEIRFPFWVLNMIFEY